jgi:hypothetical protein
MGYPAASIGSRNRFIVNRHSQTAIRRLQVSPTLNLGLIPVFWKSFEILLGELARGRSLAGVFLRDVWVSHCCLISRYHSSPRHPAGPTPY